MHIKMIVILCILFVPVIFYPKMYTVKQNIQLENLINSYTFVVVALVPTGHEVAKKKQQKIKDVIKNIGHNEPYRKHLKDALAFIIAPADLESFVHLAHDKNNVYEDDFGVVLYKNGRVVLDDQCYGLHFMQTKADVLDYMQFYWGNDFDLILQKQADQEALERQIDLARYQTFAASRYPFGGYAPYNVWGSPSASIYTGYAAFYPYGYSYNGFAYLIP